jgi:type I restriction enzyme R subunit
MMMESYLSAEDKARVEIDKMLEAAGWAVQDAREANLAAARGVAVREFILEPPHGRADYLLFVDREAVGVGRSSGSTGRKRLPARVRHVQENPLAPTLRHRLTHLPELSAEGLWPAQATAIRNLERSLAENRPRALIQMATGAGKTYTAANVAYRAVKHAGARRVLFLVDRANLGRQTLKEFQAFTTPDDGRKFTELYNVQHLSSNLIDPVARVTITTIQRLYSILKGEAELDPELDEHSAYDLLPDEPVPVAYNPRVPIETFDVVVDECHRSIYGVWRQVLDYFDAFIVGLTATPNKQAFGFFNQNLVMEYTHEQAVADSVNVDFDVYRIRTKITEQGSMIDAGLATAFRDRQTRRLRWETLDENVAYGAQALDRAVVAKDQIRTVVRAFRERLFSEIFPGRTEVPKTLIFAKDDSHADDIVQIVREEFGKGDDFAVKITYRSDRTPLIGPPAVRVGG